MSEKIGLLLLENNRIRILLNSNEPIELELRRGENGHSPYSYNDSFVGIEITNVKNGDVSANSLDVVNGSQLHAVKVIADTAVANANNNTTNINSNRTRIEKLEQSNFSAHNRINELDSRTHKNRKRSDAGIAGVAAIAVIPQVTQANEFGIGVGAATKNGQTALAVGASKAGYNNKHIVKIALSFDSQRNFTTAAGYLYKW